MSLATVHRVFRDFQIMGIFIVEKRRKGRRFIYIKQLNMPFIKQLSKTNKEGLDKKSEISSDLFDELEKANQEAYEAILKQVM